MENETLKKLSKRIKVNFEGSFFVHHSLGMVNRELISELLHELIFDIRIIRSEKDQYTPDTQSKFSKIMSIPDTPHEQPDIHIRHYWPPNFSQVTSGKLILIFPWEYGSLPIKWRDQMIDNVDEIWVPSTYLKTCYEKSGIKSDKIYVIPNGIDPLLFNSQCQKSEYICELKKDNFCFLFNGGTTTRKGIDILVNAYLNEFKADEKVCLVIKDSFSYGKELAKKINELSNHNDIAKIHYILKNFNHEELPALYNACDCYVHPYRAEGYGLPIAEALACGKPVIVTGKGASCDFVSIDYGYLINSSIEYMQEKSISGLKTVDYPFWYIPEINHLQSLMRHVFTNQNEAVQKGKTGEVVMNKNHNWSISSSKASLRLIKLSNT